MNNNYIENTNPVLSDDDLSAVSGGYSWNQFMGDVKGVGESFVQGLKDGYQQIKDITK